MSAVLKPKLTVAEYLAIEGQAEFRSEFYGGEMFAMAGASREHNTAKENLIGEAYAQLKGGPCRSLSSDQRVKVDRTGLFTYPDIVIVCGKSEYAPEDRDTLVNPQVIFEILSKSTEHYDRVTKFQHYQRLPSMREYVLVSTDHMNVEHYVRQPDGSWLVKYLTDAAEELTLVTVPVRISLRAVYTGVEFPPTDPKTPVRAVISSNSSASN